MMDSDSSLNAYEILGITDGLTASSDDIKKVYRKLAIVKHPDKNPNNTHAAAEFSQIDAAYRLLLDPAAKSALDDLLHARASRAARESQMSDKRRKMREDLESREKRVVSERNEEEVAKARLKAELDRLRSQAEKEAMERSRATVRPRDHEATSASQPLGTSSSQLQGGGGDEERMLILARTVKVSWDPSVRGWSAEELKKELEGRGVTVENVFMSDQGKGKDKGKPSAKVVMGSRESAAHAVDSASRADGLSSLLIAHVLKGSEAKADRGRGLHQELPEEGGRGEGGGVKRHKAGTLFPSSSSLSAQDRPLFPLPAVTIRAAPLFPASHSTFPSSSSSSFPKASSFPSLRDQGGVEKGFEAQVLERMRREAERKRVLAEEAEAAEV